MNKQASITEQAPTAQSPQLSAHEQFNPIEDYAAVGDCRSVALVSRKGSIDWLCFPHFSGPAVFAALLDPACGGHFAITPNSEFKVQRRYIEETNVLETCFITQNGVARLTDCLVIPDEAQEHTHLQPQQELLRIIETLDGEVALDISYAPRPDFNRSHWRLRNYGKLSWGCSLRDELFMLLTDSPLEIDTQGKTLHCQVQLRAGEKYYFSLTYSKHNIGTIVPLGSNAEERLSVTTRWWRKWSEQCAYDGPYREIVLRSALTLKLMTYSLSGAVVAAPTASLPEKIGGVRNWDYRYCWLRDATLTLGVFDKLGFHTEERAFMNWLLYTTRLSWPRLQVLYDVYGKTRLNEQTLAQFRGYRDSRPVRVGNAAHEQIQLDVYGEVILAAYHAVQSGTRLDRTAARMLTGLGHTICSRWHEPDHGIWESRQQGTHNTYSKVMCWVGLDHLLRLHQQGCLSVPAAKMQREREAIRDAIETKGFNPALNSYTTAFGVDDVDASLLLLPRWGYIPADHPRMLGTFARIEQELGHDALVFRFREGFDGLPAGEGAFGIASFWAVEYLVQRGDRDAATQRFEKLLDYANDLGLYAEEIDPQTGAALGNFPQAFTHVGLINAALALSSSSIKSNDTKRAHIIAEE
jgi:GH15 family glucan-1,4-alpha-glucosidase